MSVTILKAGLQTTLQSSPRHGLRQKGVPSGGAADLLSIALANRLLNQFLYTSAFEITLSEAEFRFDAPTHIAVTGAACTVFLGAKPLDMHKRHLVFKNDVIKIQPTQRGARSYLAIEGGLIAANWLQSKSTCLVAGLGGYFGRAVQIGDVISFAQYTIAGRFRRSIDTTPENLRPHFGQSWMLRAVAGPEFSLLSPADQNRLFSTQFEISRRASRMGAELIGSKFHTVGDGRMPSAAVFPGTIQCPPGGAPYLLMCDAGTTGGYPRIAHIIRADRHLIGQLRPGDKVQFKRTTPQNAAIILRDKTTLIQSWLGDAFELR